MTPLQYRAAVAIEKEKMAIQTIIEDIKVGQHFNRKVTTGPGTRGLKDEMKPEYQPVIDLLKARIDELNNQLLAL